MGSYFLIKHYKIVELLFLFFLIKMWKKHFEKIYTNLQWVLDVLLEK